MELYTDWKFWSLVVGLVLMVLTNVGNILVTLSNKKANKKIMENDLIHIAKDLKELKENQTKNVQTLKDSQEKTTIKLQRKISQIWKVVNIISEKQVARDALCEERHSK